MTSGGITIFYLLRYLLLVIESLFCYVFFHYSYTAVAVLEMDFDRIDINQCPRGEGNSGPNRFADTARCKQDSTEVRQ